MYEGLGETIAEEKKFGVASRTQPPTQQHHHHNNLRSREENTTKYSSFHILSVVHLHKLYTSTIICFWDAFEMFVFKVLWFLDVTDFDREMGEKNESRSTR